MADTAAHLVDHVFPEVSVRQWVWYFNDRGATELRLRRPESPDGSVVCEAKSLVKKWKTIDQTLTADGKTISLHEHDGSYTVRVNGATLMSTRQHASEEKIAELACAHLKGKSRARVLIGGLGFGFSLRAALSALAADATVVVAEIMGAVIAWNRNPLFHLAIDGMADPRVIVLQQDVGEVIRDAQSGFDIIILDVDNGPTALSMDVNRRLYDRTGLQLIHTALRSGGCVGIWSVAPDPAFERLMMGAGFQVDVRYCRSHSKSGRWHTLFLGRVK